VAKTTNWRDLRAKTIDTPEKEARVQRERQLLALERRLYNLRRQIGISQAELAERLDTTQANISRIESEPNPRVATLDNYIAGLGGRLELRVVFPDDRETITISDAEPVEA
jgi:transcriptional regulator with XRE-family HTH domain